MGVKRGRYQRNTSSAYARCRKCGHLAVPRLDASKCQKDKAHVWSYEAEEIEKPKPLNPVKVLDWRRG